MSQAYARGAEEGETVPVGASRARRPRGGRPAGGGRATRLQVLPLLEVGDHVADQASVLTNDLD